MAQLALGTPTPRSQFKLENWLASLGFSRGNPFAFLEADQERALLPEYFIDVEGYERIKGSNTIIVFAPRGGGKSALRVMLAAQAAPVMRDSNSLAVEFVDFGALLVVYRTGQAPTIDDFAPLLLRSGMEALVVALVGGRTAHAASNQENKTDARLSRLSLPVTVHLAQMVACYYPDFLAPRALYQSLQALDPGFVPEWSEFCTMVASHRLTGLVVKSTLAQNQAARLVAALCDYAEIPGVLPRTPPERFREFTYLARDLGFDRTEFLIDRVDEHQETASSAKAQADLLGPLLADLLILEMPGLAFKFFLSKEAQDVLMDRPQVRPDRLANQEVTIAWDRATLKRILNDRLSAYSQDRVHDLVNLCQNTQIGALLLGELIQREMLDLADGSPRRLIKAGQLLCEEHMQGAEPNGLLSQEDWARAKKKLRLSAVPVLRLRRIAIVAEIGGRSLRLSKQEHKILIALADAQGRCKRAELFDKVWGPIPEQDPDDAENMLDRAISRLREKLGESANDPLYLVTEKPYYIRLANYVLE